MTARLAIAAITGCLLGFCLSELVVVGPMRERCETRETDRCLDANMDNTPAFRVCESEAKEMCTP